MLAAMVGRARPPLALSLAAMRHPEEARAPVDAEAASAGFEPIRRAAAWGPAAGRAALRVSRRQARKARQASEILRTSGAPARITHSAVKGLPRGPSADTGDGNPSRLSPRYCKVEGNAGTAGAGGAQTLFTCSCR